MSVYLDVVERTWPVLRRMMGAHTVAYRLTRGLVGHRIPGGPSMLLLDHVGAKSGKKRTSPLLYIEHGDDVFIVASKGGNARHPGWYHNLRANPDTEVQIGSERRPVHARVATPEERRLLWPKAVEVWRQYRDYQERTDREIPIVILERRQRRRR